MKRQAHNVGGIPGAREQPFDPRSPQRGITSAMTTGKPGQGDKVSVDQEDRQVFQLVRFFASDSLK